MVDKKGKVCYKKTSFNQLFFVVEELIKQGVIEIYVFGGKGSGKTASLAQYISKTVFAKRYNAILMRKEGSTVKKTLKRSFVKALETTEFCSGRQLKKAFNVQEWAIKSRREGEMHFQGLDDPSKIKGIEGYNFMYLDEINQFTFEDYMEASGALRGENRFLLASWNPVDINSWIKTKVVDTHTWLDTDLKLPSAHSYVKISSDGKKALIKTLYQDNFYMVGSPCSTYGFVDQNTIDKYERMKLIDEHWYNVNVLGEWGVIKPENPFFARFEREKHLASGLKIDDRIIDTQTGKVIIALSFDFNVKNSCIAGQFDFYDKYVRILKEWRLTGIDLIELLVSVITHYGKDKHYVITGDSSGNNGSAITTGNIGAWDIIRKFLNSWEISFDMSNIPKANMRHINSRMVNNAIMFMENDYLIDEYECPELISDIERMQAGKDGGLDKKHADKNNYGHLGDCFRYFNDTLLIQFYDSYNIVRYDD